MKCGVKCDINNGAVASGTLDTGIYESNNANSILEANRWGWPIYNHEEIEYLCGSHPGVGPQSERTGALDKWWIDKGFGELVDGLSACDCKQNVRFGDGSMGNIATGCYRCAGTVTYGITESTGCYVSDSVSNFDDRAHASHFHTGRRPLNAAPVVTLPTRPRLRSLPLLLFPYYQYQRAHLI